MLKKRFLFSCAVLALAVLMGCLPQVRQSAVARAAEDGVTSDVSLKLERDGKLSVTERVTVPSGGEVHRTVPLRQAAGEDVDRVFDIRGAEVSGPGSARVTDEQLELTLPPGESTVEYQVVGAVGDPRGGTQQVDWRASGGWDVSVQRTRISFIAPKPARSIDCRAGPVGSDGKCTSFRIGTTRGPRAEHTELAEGDRIDFSVDLPEGTVPANAEFDETFSLDDAFELSPTVAAALAALGLLVIGGFGLLWYTRGRDARVSSGDVGPVDVLMTDEQGNVRFASPDGVLPGQVGTVIDEHVDVVDVTATIIDLAVRNYLWIEEVPGEQQGRDWRIVLLNPPDDSLRSYERAVHEMLFGAGGAERGQVMVSQLRSGSAPDLTEVRDRMYSDVVAQRWFSRRPDSERNLFWWIGLGVAACGVVLTAALALTTSFALLGIGVLVGGVALTFGARIMPARTKRGSSLVAQVRGLRDYLRSASADSIPLTDREMVFSRSLPYAVVLGETERWLGEFAELDPAADGTPGLYWYGELVERTGHVVPDMRRFREHFPMLVSVLDDVLARPGQVRSLR
ncbi:hypothetical protein FHR84_003385 [Actinopolyspora biskrensis]|uniref:DUF2207 domain-containing protein n=1 Tax=Actinopolyspora biskrensis TaxID=1470178 RepID=A0A852Z919_9ACTN|nr:hypothetical protein [Actinopolyspora biskrensis]